MQSSEDRSNKVEVEFSPDPLFSGIQMPVFDNLVTYFQQQYGDDFRQMPHRHDTAFIIVQHGFLNTGPILEALLYFGVNPKHVFISTKPHTTPTRMEVYLSEKFGQSYVPFWPDPDDKDQVNTGEYEALSRQACINLLDRVSESLFNPAEGNDAINNIVICDEGGRFLSEFIKLYNKPDLTHYSRKKFSDFNIVALEHTNCGTRSRELNHLHFPYIGMAKSLAKLVFESPLIVRAMFRALDAQLPDLITRGNNCFAVIGLGSIGKEVLSYLVEKYPDVKIIAYDNNPSQWLWVEEQKRQSESTWEKVEKAKSISDAAQVSSVILGCTGKNIFKMLQARDIMGRTNETHLFSCSSGQREFASILNELNIKLYSVEDLITYHCSFDDFRAHDHFSEKPLSLFIHNAGFPINFSREETAGLLPKEAQLTCSLKLAAIVQALQLLQLLLSLRFHSEEKKWCEGFIKLILQKEILSWYGKNLPKGVSYAQDPGSITQQEIESYSNDGSVLMPNFAELRAAHFNYFNGRLESPHLEPALGPLLGGAIAKIIKAYKTGLSYQKNALIYYLPTEVVEKAPHEISITEYAMALEVQKLKDEIKEEDKSHALDDTMADYLASDIKMLLLLGEPGAGKSLFAWDQTKQLYHAQIHNVLGQRWLPVIIELKHYSLSQIEGLLNHCLMSEYRLSADELCALQGQDINSGYRLLVILEGFDELKKDDDPNVEKQFSDCVKTCLENSGWDSAQVKIVVTCRLRHLKSEQQEESYFGHQASHTSQSDYRRRVLLPFSQKNIDAYVKHYVERQVKSQLSESPLTLADYLRVIRNTPALHDLVSNPLILRLFVEALPQLHRNKPSLENITRYDIYDAFVAQWFRRETKRLDKVIKDQIGLAATGDDALQNAENIFTSYAVLLAGQMHQKNSLEVSLRDLAHPAAVTWNNLSEKIAATINQQVAEQLSQKYRKLTTLEIMEVEAEDEIDISDEEKYISHHKKKTKKTLLKSVMASLEAFKDTCPLQQLGEVCSFIHKSLYEFFLAKGIVLTASSEKPLEERANDTLSMLSVSENYKERRIHHEPEALKFLEEIWVGHGHEPLFERVKESLFEVIERSKGHPENGPSAANAVTILNWMGVMLTDKKWQEIQIPGAYLPYAVLLRTNFTDAILRDVNLFSAQLMDVILIGAQLSGAELGRHVAITTRADCSAIAHHPTKPWIAIGYEDGTVRQFNTQAYCWVGGEGAGHDKAVGYLTYSSDGCLLASSSSTWVSAKNGSFNSVGGSGEVLQWLSETGELLGTIATEQHTDIACIAYSPGGQYLAYGCGNGDIVQKNTATHEPYGEILKGHNLTILEITYSPNGKLLASAACGGALCQWTLATGTPLWLIEERTTRRLDHEYPVHNIAYSSGGDFLARKYGGSISLWDLNTMQCHPVSSSRKNSSLFLDRRSYIIFSADGKFFSYLDLSSMEIVQRSVSLKQVLRFPIKKYIGDIMRVTYNSKRKILVSACSDSLIHHSEIEVKSYGKALGHSSSVNSVTLSPGGQLLASGSADKTIRQWSIATGEPFGMPINVKNYVKSITYSPNMSLLASAHIGGVRQWEIETGNPFGPPLSHDVNSITYSPNGLWLTGSGGKCIFQWKSETGRQISKVICTTTGANISKIAYSLDGQCFVWSTQAGDIFSLPCSTEERVVVPSWARMPDSNSLSSDEAANNDSYTYLVKPGRAKPGEHLRKESVPIACSPSFNFIAIGRANGELHQCNVATNIFTRFLTDEHSEAINSLAYSPDKQLLASGSEDATVRQWIAATGEPFGPVMLWHTDAVTCIAYSPDGNYLASSSRDGCVAVWHVMPDVNEKPHIAWCSRTVSMPLRADGLQLTGVLGLEVQQLAMLAFSGSEEAEQMREEQLKITGQSSFFSTRQSSSSQAVSSHVASSSIH